MKERWKVFAKGNYEVSNQGNVRRKTPGRRTWPGRPTKLVLMGMGYYVVSPTIDGKNVLLYVHRIVAEAFIGPSQTGLEINHIDGVKINNRVDNLEYVTHQENMDHAGRMGFMDRGHITDDTSRQVRVLRSAGWTWAAIEGETGVSSRHARDIFSYRRKKDQCQ